MLAVVCFGMIWSVAIGYAVVEFLDPHGRFGLFIPFLAFATLCVVRYFITHDKEISFDKVYLYIRNRKTEVRIPLSQVSGVHYNFFLKRVVIKLESETPFGPRITLPAPYGNIYGSSEFLHDLMDNVNSFKGENSSGQSSKA